MPIGLEHKPPSQLVHSAAVYRRIATLFLALTAGVVFLAFYVVLSRATVTVLSKQEPVKADFIVDIARAPADGSGDVKGEVLSLSDTKMQTFPSASVMDVALPAEGKVRIVSTLQRPQTLIATTRLLAADGTLLRLAATVVVPPAGTIEAAAHADQAGPQGAIADGAALTIPGLNPDSQRFFTVTASGAFVEGKKDLRMIAAPDIDRAAGMVKDALTASLTDRLRGAARDAGLSDAGEIVQVDEVSRSSDAQPGSDAKEFSVTMTARATGVFYDKAAFDAQVRQKLSAKLMDDRELLSVDQGSLTVGIEKTDLAAHAANLHVAVQGTAVISKQSPGLNPAKLTGISTDAARKYVESLDGVASASVRTRPFWVGRMPGSPERITIEVR